MAKNYLVQLIAIHAMLDIPQPETMQEAYDSLFQLWLKFLDNADFGNNLDEIAHEHPKIVQ